MHRLLRAPTAPLLQEKRSVAYAIIFGIWAEVFLYCLLHDQYLVRIAPEHFTIYHEPLWGIGNPSLLAAAWAFRASIGPGLILGLAALFLARAGSLPKIAPGTLVEDRSRADSSHRSLRPDCRLVGMAEPAAPFPGSHLSRPEHSDPDHAVDPAHLLRGGSRRFARVPGMDCPASPQIPGGCLRYCCMARSHYPLIPAREPRRGCPPRLACR